MQPQTLVSYKQGLLDAEEFFSPEHHVPAVDEASTQQGLIDDRSAQLIEVCTTMAHLSWGYTAGTAGEHLYEMHS